MAKLAAFLDANVLFPAPVRDLLLNLAALGNFQPKWSAEVQEEWLRNLMDLRPDLERKSLLQSQQVMDAAFPDAMVVDFHDIINTLQLPDSNDRHVLAAAIKGNASILVTENLNDFPIEVLRIYGIRPLSADQFLSQVFSDSFSDVIQAFHDQVAKLKKPPKTASEVLETLRRCNLKITAGLIEQGIIE